MIYFEIKNLSMEAWEIRAIYEKSHFHVEEIERRADWSSRCTPHCSPRETRTSTAPSLESLSIHIKLGPGKVKMLQARARMPQARVQFSAAGLEHSDTASKEVKMREATTRFRACPQQSLSRRA